MDFNLESRREIIKVEKMTSLESAPPDEPALDAPPPEFEERWTGSCVFENEWQSFRTRKDRTLELTSAPHTHPNPGRYIVAVKVIDIFGNDTMTLVPVKDLRDAVGLEHRRRPGEEVARVRSGGGGRHLRRAAASRTRRQLRLGHRHSATRLAVAGAR